MSFSIAIDVSELRTAFDAKTATLTANKRLGQKDQWRTLELQTLTAATTALQSSIAWTQVDDQEVRSMFVKVSDTAAGATVTATLTEDTGDTKFLADATFAVSVAAINGTTQASQGFTSTSGVRGKLLRGVRYRLTLSTVGATVDVIEGGVQLRGVRRGGAGGPAIVPCGFPRASGNVDVDKINWNLAGIAGDLEDSQDARYTYGTAFYDLAGVVDTNAAVLRQIPIRRPASGNAIEVVGVELVMTNAQTGPTWTLSKVGDTTWPTINVVPSGADVEVYASSDVSMQAASHTADTVLQLAASTSSGKTITYGYVVVHTRTDRWNQGSVLTRYAPTVYSAATSTASATLQAEIDAIASRVAEDTAASVDLRCECFTVRTLASGSSRTWTLPSGQRRILGTVSYIVGAIGPVATTTVVGTGLSGSSVVATATGAALLAASNDAASGSMSDDPTNSAADAIVTTTISGGGTALLVIVLVFWD